MKILQYDNIKEVEVCPHTGSAQTQVRAQSSLAHRIHLVSGVPLSGTLLGDMDTHEAITAGFSLA